MSILDDAIREHLELKRQHGADDSELKQLEDEAFGPAERPSAEQALPDPAAEAPTEFMTPSSGPAEEVAEPAGEKEGSRREPGFGIADLQEGPEQDQPTEEEHPAMEHEAAPQAAESPPASEHSTEERHAIAEQPTELFDVEGEIAASESRSPSDEELVEEEIQEPRLAPVDPLAGLEEIDEEDVSVEDRAQDAAVEGEEEDDFFDEQRLSEELDQALEDPAASAPAPVELEPLPELEDEDLEAEDESAGDGFEEEEHGEEDEPEEPAEGDEQPTGDVLGGTPDFLEETPEDDQLWFEQKPPKDFDFDD